MKTTWPRSGERKTAPGGAAFTIPRRRLRSLAVPVIVGAVVFLSLGPDVLPFLSTGLPDRLAHGAAYCFLAVMCFAAIDRRFPRRRVGSLLAVAVALALGGALIEVIQGLLHRDADPVDAAANAAGIVLALALWPIVRVVRRRRLARARSVGAFRGSGHERRATETDPP